MSKHLFTRFEEGDNRVGNPFVTISYEVGACGISVVEYLCEYLRKNDCRKGNIWRVFDNGLIKKVIEDYNLPNSIVPYLSESTFSEFEDIVESVFGTYPSRYTLVYEMNQTILRVAQEGYVIIVGRGANMVSAKLSNGIHVRLIGSIESRIRYIEQHLNMPRKKAIAFMLKENEKRIKYFWKYFDKHINDPSLYDVVINTDRLSIQDIVSEIGNLVLKQHVFSTTGNLGK